MPSGNPRRLTARAALKMECETAEVDQRIGQARLSSQECDADRESNGN